LKVSQMPIHATFKVVAAAAVAVAVAVVAVALEVFTLCLI